MFLSKISGYKLKKAYNFKLIKSGFQFFSTKNKITYKCSPTKTHKCEPPPKTITAHKEELLEYYKNMGRIRKFELACDITYKAGLIKGFCHLYVGQEAVAVGIESAISFKDHLITAYRCHGQALLRGDTMKSMFSELLGKETGSSHGKGGSMHLYNPQNNFYGGNGIVGAQVPVGGGIALTQKYNKTKNIVIVMFGDGAANQGQVYETCNMAALWKLPMIFIIENNKYGMGTSIERSSYSCEYYTRGDYIPGIQCNGLDVLSVKSTMEHAAKYCREGNGPIFVEMITYRYHGHSMSDPGKTYRSKDEVQDIRKKRDPILSLKNTLLENKFATSSDLRQIDREARKEVDDALKSAKRSKNVNDIERFRDIYCGKQDMYIRSTDRTESYGTLES